jgi:hypothetical protein
VDRIRELEETELDSVAAAAAVSTIAPVRIAQPRVIPADVYLKPKSSAAVLSRDLQTSLTNAVVLRRPI